jgi:hypothetical protein
MSNYSTEGAHQNAASYMYSANEFAVTRANKFANTVN